MKPVLNFINKIIDVVGWICVFAMLLMIVNVFIDVFVRYVVVDAFKAVDLYLWYDKNLSWLGGVGMQELEWHWFSVMFLLGLSYTLREDGHVRVDVFYDNFSRRTQAWINILGTLIFTIPFCILVVHFSWDFFVESYMNQENRGDPGSLPRLWPVKFFLPVSFALLILSAIAVILKESLVLTDSSEEAAS
jgi:TRAP-type mannitol/chloroaromatic compound transport system permease small subunit